MDQVVVIQPLAQEVLDALLSRHIDKEERIKLNHPEFIPPNILLRDQRQILLRFLQLALHMVLSQEQRQRISRVHMQQ